MNIALLLEQSFDPNAGGVQRTTSKLAKIFKDRGHNIIIISTNVKLSKIKRWLEIPIYHVNIKRDNGLFNRIIENESISIIINQAGYSVPLTKFLLKNKHNNVKLINTLRINPLSFYDNYKDSIGFFFKQRNLNFLNNIITQKLWLGYHILLKRFEFNYLIKNTDAFVLLSERFKEDLYLLSPGSRKFHTKIHGITNPFERPYIDIEETVREKENIILFVGRLHIVQKRVDLLMEIWHKLHDELPDWKFCVVGDGESKTMMENYCKKNNLNRVTFFGKDNPNDYYKRSKIFHLTSSYEGFGNVLIEAQSYGCVPLLFNSYSSAQDIVTDQENGILIEPFEIEQYVNQTQSLINDPKRLFEMALNSYENVNRFSYDETYKKWDAVFKSLEQ